MSQPTTTHDAIGRTVHEGDRVGGTTSGPYQETITGPVVKIEKGRVKVRVDNQPGSNGYRPKDGDEVLISTSRVFLLDPPAAPQPAPDEPHLSSLTGAAALRTASELAHAGCGTGDIPAETRAAVAAWLSRLASETERRARSAHRGLTDQETAPAAPRTPPGRPFADLSVTGLLWLFNHEVLHPQGFALALHADASGHVDGWSLMPSPDGDPWTFDPATNRSGRIRAETTLTHGPAVDTNVYVFNARSVNHNWKCLATPEGLNSLCGCEATKPMDPALAATLPLCGGCRRAAGIPHPDDTH